MRNINKKGFTLVELLAVIVVLAIVMSLAVVAITNVLDTTRKNSFAADAKSFLEGAHQLVSSDTVSSYFGASGQYAPPCNATANTRYIPIAAINLERGGTKSPYGNNYNKGTDTTVKSDAAPSVSYVKVSTTAVSNGNCKYTYSIYLTDGVFSIGTQSAPIEESNVSGSSVK